ncbi:MAG TPA: hypothetical protein VK754_00230 [Propionibacteriaceae bacterium]|nr:hypothetical protein [Propionibacteriaceae bacterium]
MPMTAQKSKRRFGLPFSGYQSSVSPHLAVADKATSDGPSSARRSKNMLFNPLEGKFYRRAGTLVVNSSGFGAGVGLGGLVAFPDAWQVIALRSPNSMDSTLAGTDNNYPVHCALWTATEVNYGDQGFVHFYSMNNNGGSPFGDTILGQEFSTTTNYPITEDGGVPYSRAWPYLLTTIDEMGRFHSTRARAQAAPGSRRMLDIGDRLFVGNFNGTPWNWNKDFNDTNTDTGDVLRVLHTGHPAPLGMPDIAAGTVSTVGPWHDKDVFYISVAYRYTDGSVSMPIIPRDPNDDIDFDPGSTNQTGFGKVQIDSAGTTRYEWITWSEIPIGPPGVVGRYLLRTPKNAAGTGQDPSIKDLRITAYLDNNTVTTYNDPNGNDLALLADLLLVRLDHIMQPPSRYMGTCDGRVTCGYTKIHPVAIYVCPEVNASDGDAVIDDEIYSYSLTGGTLTFSKTTGAATTTRTITNIGSISIQRLVDKINNTTAGNGGKWWACVAPGADATALCDDIGTAADNDNLFSVTGATNFSGDGNGIVRAWCSGWPAPIFWSSVYRANYPVAKRRIFFTMGDPGMPTSAADSWAAGNFRDAPNSYGDYMGGAPLPNGSVECFTDGIMVLQNRRTGISGEDTDYRLYELNASRGCVSTNSITSFNGVVGYLTIDGYVVTDGREEVIISSDVWNSSTQTGEWAYEIAQSSKTSKADISLIHGFAAKAMGGKLYCAYRLSSSYTGGPGHLVIYDFSGSSQFSGLRGALRPDGAPWGWSTPLVTVSGGWGTMGEVSTSGGIKRYVAISQSLTTGLVYQIEVGSNDNSDGVGFPGTAFTSELWTARDLAETLKQKAAQEMLLLYKKNGTGLTLKCYRDALGTTQSGATITLPTTSTDNFKKKRLPLEQKIRALSDSLEFRFTDDGSGTDAPQIYGFDLDLVIADSYR